MSEKRNLNGSPSMSMAEIFKRFPMREARAISNSNEQAEGLQKKDGNNPEQSSSTEGTAQASADARSVFANLGQARPAEAMLEILDSAPLIIRKPLSLVEDHAYAATWVYMRDRELQSVDRSRGASRNAALSEQKQLIIRDDGLILGDGFEDIRRSDIEVHLHEIPRPDKLWSGGGIRAYQSGELPECKDVFNRITQVVDRFMDFNDSLADQQTMCELIACYILSTWFLDAFNVIGYLWSNGVHGSGKTQLLSVISELGYLGDMLLSGSTFASLRDRADYGATLCLDDAEDFANARGIEADKRAMFLSGNRRGTSVTVKEPAPDRKWVTRQVSVYGPKLFSAISQPEEILASRVIVVPLIRSAK